MHIAPYLTLLSSWCVRHGSARTRESDVHRLWDASGLCVAYLKSCVVDDGGAHLIPPVFTVQPNLSRAVGINRGQIVTISNIHQHVARAVAV